MIMKRAELGLQGNYDGLIHTPYSKRDIVQWHYRNLPWLASVKIARGVLARGTQLWWVGMQRSVGTCSGGLGVNG
jgi:hypothetical protein